MSNSQPRCTGACCRGFTLDRTREQVRAMVNADADFIADMLIPIETLERGRAWTNVAEHLGYKPAAVERAGHRTECDLYVYTCKHHDGESGRCTVYAERPAMCSTFPYEKECPFEGCTVRLGLTDGVESDDEARRRIIALGRTSEAQVKAGRTALALSPESDARGSEVMSK